MNLRQQTLVAFKTKVKDNRGNILIYGGKTSGARYRFLRDEGDGTFATCIFTVTGQRFNGTSGERIQEVGHVWQPSEGDRVIVHGPVFSIGMSDGSVWSQGDEFTLGVHLVTNGNNEQFRTTLRGGGAAIIHRRNIKRLV